MKLDLEKVWEICNTLSNKESELSEQGNWLRLLGYQSNYCDMPFEEFLNYYSFRVEDKNIVVYNSDPVPYESCNTEDYSYVPICLLSFSAEKIEEWIEEEIEKHLEKQRLAKIAEREEIKRQIERLTKKLEQWKD